MHWLRVSSTNLNVLINYIQLHTIRLSLCFDARRASATAVPRPRAPVLRKKGGGVTTGECEHRNSNFPFSIYYRVQELYNFA